MSQKLSPFVEAKYGWDFGESGWNTGADENWLKFSFLFDKNVDGLVDSLPTNIPDGSSYYLTSDKRVYFSVAGSLYSTPLPKWFVFTSRSTGVSYRYNGVESVEVQSNEDILQRVVALEQTDASLGTAAFQPDTYFATQSQLDVASSEQSAYTDQLRAEVYTPLLMKIGSQPAGQVELAPEYTNPLKARVFATYSPSKYEIQIPDPDKLLVWHGGASPNVRYVNGTSGSDANTGTSASPWKSLAYALANTPTPAEIVLVNDFIYRDQSGLNSSGTPTTTLPERLKISSTAPSGKTCLGSIEPHSSLTWTSVGGGVYSASRSVVTSIFDRKYLDSLGSPSALKLVGSLTECTDTPGSAFLDYASGSTIYVHLLDNRAPDTSVVVTLNVGSWNWVQADTGAVFLENLECYLSRADFDGLRLSSSTTPNTAVFQTSNVGFLGASYNGLSIVRTNVVYNKSSFASYNGRDGFNYHDGVSSNSGMSIYESTCFGGYAGAVSYVRDSVQTGSDNCSTAHDGMEILRVGCNYAYSKGGVVADVNGALSLNYGVSTAYSNTDDPLLRRNFYHNADTTGTIRSMYLIGCSSDSENDCFAISTTTPSTAIKVKYWKGDIAAKVEGTIL